MVISRVVIMHVVDIVTRTVTVVCQPRFVQRVLKTAAAFQNKRIV
jgi:hypothetical protein